MLSVKSMDNLGFLWKDWRSRVQACELEGEAARSGAAKAIQFHHAKVGYIEKKIETVDLLNFLPTKRVSLLMISMISQRAVLHVRGC